MVQLCKNCVYKDGMSCKNESIVGVDLVDGDLKVMYCSVLRHSSYCDGYKPIIIEKSVKEESLYDILYGWLKEILN